MSLGKAIATVACIRNGPFWEVGRGEWIDSKDMDGEGVSSEEARSARGPSP